MKNFLNQHQGLVLATAFALAGGFAGCGTETDDSSRVFAGGDGPGTPDGGTAASSVIQRDFEAPILDTGVPADAPEIFGKADAAGQGPCLIDPEVGSLFPNNWLRPKFRFAQSAQENLFEIRVEVPNQKSPLRMYTTKSGYIMPASAWKVIAATTKRRDIKIRIRSAVIDSIGKLVAGPFAGTSGDMSIAPIPASGNLVYWTTSGGSVLKGFKIGDEKVQPVVTPAQAGSKCVACHASTPDGKYVGMTLSQDITNGNTLGYVAIKAMDPATPDPSYITASAKTLLARLDQQAPTFSKNHWQDGDHTVLTMFKVGGKTEIVWTDLESSSSAMGVGWGTIARNGDSSSASASVFSHDGKTIVYTRAPTTSAGTITPSGQLLSVPYNNRAGGDAVPIPGASEPGQHQFYPTFSANDSFLAFNRAATGSSASNAAAEVFVLPRNGGTPTRLRANDPAACLNTRKSPGVTNSWPKWSPEVRSVDGTDYYFLVFSSTREDEKNMRPQLYVAPISVTSGVVTSYPALSLWNQPADENNHTPAWDVFDFGGIR